jgi:dTDP-glucose 4,6-dehydratase
LRLLITGGAGFIGSNFIRHLLATRVDIEIVNFDHLTYAGNPENLADIISDQRYQFVRGDISDREIVNEILTAVRFDALVNFAARPKPTWIEASKTPRRSSELTFWEHIAC